MKSAPQAEPHPMRCRVCNAEEVHKHFSIQEMMFGTRESFDYFLCGNCGCLQISEIPADLKRHYPSNYYSLEDDRSARRTGLSAVSRYLLRQRVRAALFDKGHRIARFIGRGRPMPKIFFESQPNVLKTSGLSGFDAKILDVGCGDAARWLRNLAQLGFNQLWGVNPFIKCSRKDAGIILSKRNLADFARERNGEFELVVFNHSLEHIPNQIETLSAAVRLLKRDGACVVRLPILPCSSWTKYGTNWVELDAPRHLYIHSHRSIKWLADKVGLNLHHVSYDTSAFEFYGSEQYLRDIALTDPRSYWVNPNSSLFSADQLKEFDRLAAQANRTATAGRAVFLFRRI